MPYKVNESGWLKIMMLAYVVVLVGCSQISNLNVSNDKRSLPFAITQTPPEGNPPMPQIFPTPNSSSTVNLIEKAKEDLAHRLSIPMEQINVLEAEEVTWPDASIGCPQAGMVYAQVLTLGYLIRLEYNNQEFEYHASKGTEVIYCEHPTPPFYGTPSNT